MPVNTLRATQKSNSSLLDCRFDNGLQAKCVCASAAVSTEGGSQDVTFVFCHSAFRFSGVWQWDFKIKNKTIGLAFCQGMHIVHHLLCQSFKLKSSYVVKGQSPFGQALNTTLWTTMAILWNLTRCVGAQIMLRMPVSFYHINTFDDGICKFS